MDFMDDGQEKVGPLRLVFYTPDAELAESAPHLSSLSRLSRMGRKISHGFNRINSQYTSLSLQWLPNEDRRPGGVYYDRSAASEFLLSKALAGVCDFSCAERAEPEDFEREGSSEIEEVGDEGDSYFGWKDYSENRSPKKEPGMLVPTYCHAELLLGPQTYSIRWGSLLSRQTNKRYSDSANMLSWINFSLTSEATAAVQRFCEKCVDDVDGFNYLGIYLNFAPTCLKETFLENGISHRPNKNVVFCSEFVARVLCNVGVLEDVTGEFTTVEGVASPLWNEGTGTLAERPETNCVTVDEALIGPLGKLGIVLKRGIVVGVAPALMSPNSLYLALRMKMQVCQELGLLLGSSEAWAPFSGPWHHCINCVLLPTA